MKHENVLLYEPPPDETKSDLSEWHDRGVALGRAHPDSRLRSRKRKTPPDRRRRVRDLVTRAAANSKAENAAWAIENFRLIYSAERESREFALGARDTRAVTDSAGADTPRVCLLAREYLNAAGQRYREADLKAFLEGFQETAPLDVSEIWNLKPALQLELLDRLTAGEAAQWPVLVTSLRSIGETFWRELAEDVSGVTGSSPATPRALTRAWSSRAGTVTPGWLRNWPIAAASARLRSPKQRSSFASRPARLRMARAQPFAAPT